VLEENIAPLNELIKSLSDEQLTGFLHYLQLNQIAFTFREHLVDEHYRRQRQTKIEHKEA
jgi:hypothetical protein